jgi:UDP-GlcNAc:undecaprenyl-phosphate GlcNAc-1-phosphate transferase
MFLYPAILRMTMTYILSFFMIALVFAIGWYLFKKYKILDRPGADLKWVRWPVPTLMWIFAYLSLILVVLVLFPDMFSNRIFLGLILWVLPIILVELVEELGYMWKVNFRVPQIIRLLAHIWWAILAVYIWDIWAWQEFVYWDFVWKIPQWFFVIFFVIWSMLCINAINRIDGINGQASGVSAIWFLTIFLLIKFVVMKVYTTFTNWDVLVLVSDLSLILFFVSLISTIVEFKPFGLLRDVWIMFFGFSLAYLSVVWWAKIGTLVVALSLVIFDALWVWLYRIFVLKKNPMKWDYTHIHHRLMWLGWSRWEVRAFVWIWSLVMMILMLMQEWNRLHKIIIFAMMALIFFGVNAYIFLVKKKPCGLQGLKKD